MLNHLKKPLSVLLVFGISTISVLGQVNYFNELKMPVGAPPSPEAASIEKFGNIPVGYATGVPDINIPIWKIKCGSLEWPLSLSYHAGGIKVDENASMTGLGWSLTGQGIITRTVIGKPDEQGQEPDYNNITPANYQYLYSVRDGLADAEFDIFSFNFNGRSGKFVVKQDGDVMQIPASDLKISYTAGFGSFTVTDENGIVYLFNNTEITNTNVSTPQGPVFTEYFSSWHLSKVELPDKKNIIEFTYDFGGLAGQYYYTFNHGIGERYGGTPSLVEFSEPSISSEGVSINLARLKKISFPNGSLVLNYDATGRKDLGAQVFTKLSSIVVNEAATSDTIPIKKFDFSQSYFYYNPANEPDNVKFYRLRLDSLSETVISNGTYYPKKYKFQYNSTPIVPRGNYGQDIWGFNNDKWTNQTLLKTQHVVFSNNYKTFDVNIGSADRSVNAEKMKACILSSITYPTGGKTVFNFEPHTYLTDVTGAISGGESVSISGDQPDPQIATTTFTLPGNLVPYGVRLVVNMSKITFPGVTQRSFVSLKNTTTGTIIYLNSAYPNQDYSENRPINLESGHVYELKAQVFSNTSNPQLTASIGVEWKTSTSQPIVGVGGGLRVKEILNYRNANDATPVSKDTLVYDDAITLTPFKFINEHYREVHYRLGIKPPGQNLMCHYYYSPVCRIYSSGSVYKTTTAMGSPMLYPRVQKISIDPVTNIPNGKSEYIYDVIQDDVIPVGMRVFSYRVLSNDWKNGFLQSETHYKYENGNYTPVRSVSNGYGVFNTNYTNFLFVQPQWINEGCDQSDQTTVHNDFLYYPFPVTTGSKRLIGQGVTEYDTNSEIETLTIHYYNSSQHGFPTETVVVDSKKGRDSTVFKRPVDFQASGNVYDKMVQRNIISPVVEKKTYHGTNPLGSLKTNYKDFNNDGKIIAAEDVQVSYLNNSPETRMMYYSYDSYANVTSGGKTNDAKESYIWGYKDQYPIAMVLNAPIKDIAHTSFEADNKGSWTYSGTPVFDATAPTGRKTFKIVNSANNITKSGLSATSTYIVSYWKKSGTVSVNSTTPVTGSNINGWTYHEHKVTNPAGGIITVSGTNGVIDELRLYPLDAQMTTYTYDPLIGITTRCDVDNMVTYYEYDDFGRLKHIRDQDKNIVKKICYNYAGQPENCLQFPNDDKSGNYTRNNCGAGYVGSSVYVSIPNGMFTSTVSVADANLQATNYGQAQANLNGTCTAVCTNCTGRDKKCIGGVCKTGIRVNVQSYPFGSGYRCVFYYRWSDGSTSPEYFENTSQPCMIN